MFALCENMKWAHLPIAGGLEDQSPDFIRMCHYMFQERAKYEAKKAKEEERKAEIERRQSARRPGRGASRGRY